MVSMETFKFFFFLFLLFLPTGATIDITFAQYQYISDHLTEEECHRLVAALHFPSFELPKEINAAERRLPEDASCLDLLLHWNSTPREGKGRTHIEVCHRLTQIGREDLAKWLSKAVFRGLSKDLQRTFNGSEKKENTPRPQNKAAYCETEKKIDEAAWTKMDSAILIFIDFALVAITISLICMCLVCCRRRWSESYKDYQKLDPCHD